MPRALLPVAASQTAAMPLAQTATPSPAEILVNTAAVCRTWHSDQHM